MRRRSEEDFVPEGAIVECLVVEQERGLQARKVLSIDLSTAVVPELGRNSATHSDRIATLVADCVRVERCGRGFF